MTVYVINQDCVLTTMTVHSAAIAPATSHVQHCVEGLSFIGLGLV